MKKVLNTTVLLFSFLLITKNSIAQANFNDLNLDWSVAKSLVLQGNLLKVPVNQNTIDLLDRIVPKISSSGIPGCVNEIANILFEQKNIKFLDPEFRTKITMKCISLKQYIQNKDFPNIGLQVYDLGAFIFDFIDKAKPLPCETNNTGTIILVNNSNNPYNVSLNDNFLISVPAKGRSEKLSINVGANQKLYSKEAVKFFAKEKVYSINVNTCLTNTWVVSN